MRSVSSTRLSFALRAAAALLLFAAAPLFAQTNYTTAITLADMQSANPSGTGSAPVAYARVCAYAADIQGNPINVSAPTWGFILKGAPVGCQNVVAGAFATPLTVPDASHTNLSGPIYYNLTIQQTTSTGSPVGQAIFLQAVPNITGAAWALDAYAPAANVPVIPSSAITQQSSAPSSCTTSIYLPSSTSATPAVPEFCQNGVYVPFPSSGSGSAATFSAYSNTTAYTAGNVVLYNNIGYIATASTVGNLPTNTAYWTPLWDAAGAAASVRTSLNALATPGGIIGALGYTPQPTGSISSVGLNALWDFSTMASNTVADQTGNGNAILCGSAGTSGFATPTLTPQGLFFEVPAAGGVANSGCDVPAALNGDRTFVFLAQQYPMPTSTYNGTVNYASNSAQTLLGTSAAGGMLFESQTQNASYFMSPGMQNTTNTVYTFSSDRAVGWHVLAFTCGSNTSTDQDKSYIDGVLTTSSSGGAIGYCSGLQTAAGGHYQLGGYLNSSYFYGTIALGAAASGELTQAQIQQITLYMQGLAPARSIVLNPPPYRGPTPSLVGLGDSIMACYLVSPSTSCAILNLTTKLAFTPVNQGIGGITGASVVANLPIRLGQIGIPQTGQNVALWQAGTNDMATGIGTCGSSLSATANAVWQNAVAGAQLAHSYGFKIFVETVLSGANLSPCTQTGLSTFTANTSSTTNPTVLTNVSSFTGLAEGQLIAAAGIPAYSEIVALNPGASTITINQSATATQTGVTITPSGYSKDQLRAIYNTTVRTQWRRYFDGIADTAADPHFPDGGYVNATYYADAPDGTHLTAAAQVFKEASYSQAYDRITVGSSNDDCDATTITNAASPYADQAADGCRTVDTVGGNVVVNLMSALYQTGQTKRYCNNSSGGSNTLTINAPSDFPFNGLSGSTSITVAQNTCANFTSTLVSVQTGGDYWRTVN
jgi:hypothetical protein